MEAQRLMLNYALVQFKAAGCQTVAGTRMTGIKNRHIIFFRHFVDCGEQRSEVLFCIDVFLTVRGKQDVFTLFQSQTCMDIRCFNLRQIHMQHLSHRGTGNVSTLLRQSCICQITTRVLRIGHVNIGDDIYNAAVCFLRQALVLAAVACFHMEDGDMQALGTDNGIAAISL